MFVMFAHKNCSDLNRLTNHINRFTLFPLKSL